MYDIKVELHWITLCIFFIPEIRHVFVVLDFVKVFVK